MLHLSQPSQDSGAKVIAAIPCFNTERFIDDVVSTTKKYVDQVIVIDDGSDDSTAEAARAAGALVINHGINRGYGEAIKSCFKAAKANAADILIILDGDGQHNPDEIPKLLSPSPVCPSRSIARENHLPQRLRAYHQ
ncbi:Undecaprenyl-phosphate 4-deoxy-4-formamido-L-arabinose transferase [subsurface metagenome]